MFDQSKLKLLGEKPISIAVVGHVNDGKSSTLQTLCHDPEAHFEVANKAGTTDRAKDWNIKYNGTTYMVLRDTPGLQHATEALEATGNHVHFKPAAVLKVFEDKRYLTDSRALDAAMRSDYLLYVVDVTAKATQDRINEFIIFQKTRPTITLFNFFQDKDSNHAEWSEKLREAGMHYTCVYDAHHFNIEHERDLYKQLLAAATGNRLHVMAIEGHREIMEGRWRKNGQRACDAIARLLVQTTTTLVQKRKHVARGEVTAAIKQMTGTLVEALAKAESDCFKEILKSYGLPENSLERRIVDTETGKRIDDEFLSFDWKKYLGGGVVSGAATGAAIGGAIDACLGGTSFLLGAVLGAATGAAIGFVAGKTLQHKYDERDQTLMVFLDKADQLMILARALHLVFSVQRRGLADSETPLVVGPANEMQGKLKKDKQFDELIDLLGKESNIEEMVCKIASGVGVWMTVSDEEHSND